MKTLYVIRHAKSSWDDVNLSDFDRPLNERGKRDAPRMGKRLKEKEIHPDQLISSPAKRAMSTCKRIAEVLALKKDCIKAEPALYHADADQILNVVRQINPKNDTIFIFGHNPGMTEFVELMNPDKTKVIDNIPTCGVVALQFPTHDWQSVDFGKGKLLFFDYPKSKTD
jgi:phosphohistidine phosphatase